jgi:PAS domain S-box-containing protein
MAKGLLGVSANDLVGESLYKIPIFSKFSIQILKKIVRDSFLKKKVDPIDVQAMINGSDATIQCHTSLVADGGEKVLFLILRNVTKIRQSDKTLMESEHRYRELFDNMQSGVAVYYAIEEGKDFVLTDFNKAAQRSDKVRREDVVGKRITKVFPGIEKIGFLKVLRRVWKTGKAEHFPPTIYEDKRLGKVWWEDYVYKLPTGEVVAAFANITERIKASKDLEKSVEEVKEERDKIHTIVQSIADGVFVVDKNYKIILFNEAAALMSGHSAKEAIGMRYDDVLKFMYEKNERKPVMFVKDAMETGRPQSSMNHTILIDRSGDWIPVAYSAAPVNGPKGPHGAVVIFRDVTKEREVDKMKTEFVSIASHQLHTPLTGVKWFLELMLRGKAGAIPENQRKYLEQVYASNERMIILVEDLLSVSRIESGDRFTFEKKHTDVIKMIDEVIDGNIDLIKEYKVTVVKQENVPKQLTLNVDPDKIRQVFYNLISNAVKYSKPHGNVEIGYNTDRKDVVTFFVKDHGFGIPKRQQHRIFEKFFRADNVVTKITVGTGLGLYIVKSLVEAHGGELWFTSTENIGTTFSFTIPKGTTKKRKRSKQTTRSTLGKKK